MANTMLMMMHTSATMFPAPMRMIPSTRFGRDDSHAQLALSIEDRLRFTNEDIIP